MILSIDLASRRYRDNGIALVAGDRTLEFIAPAALGLTGEPQVNPFADAIARLAAQHHVGLILLDGPQGWRADWSPPGHARACERATRTPGKTGPPGVVKPGSWTRMAEFSIALFDALDARGWPRIDHGWTQGPAAIESFPTQAWRSLGHPTLPGKAKARDLAPWVQLLRAEGLRSAGWADASHDDVQAAVAALAGLQLLAGGLAAADVRGLPPTFEGGHWREGFIVSPRRG